MSVEVNIAEADYMGDRLTFLDCPGSIEFAYEAEGVLAAVDLAVVVAEPDEKKIPALQVILKTLEDRNVPRILFLNKMDKADAGVRETLLRLQPASQVPLVLRQLPIWQNGIVTGFVDLALERAFVYREHAASEVIELKDAEKIREVEARFHMLETLADYDDSLMEQLLGEIEPPRDAIFGDLVRELRKGRICPVLIGSAERGNGVGRLLKAIRHESPGIDETRARLQIEDSGAVKSRAGPQDHPYAARRQGIAVARAQRNGRRRRRDERARGAGRPRIRCLPDDGTAGDQARSGARRRHRRPRQARRRQDRHDARHRAQCAGAAGSARRSRHGACRVDLADRTEG